MELPGEFFVSSWERGGALGFRAARRALSSSPSTPNNPQNCERMRAAKHAPRDPFRLRERRRRACRPSVQSSPACGHL